MANFPAIIDPNGGAQIACANRSTDLFGKWNKIPESHTVYGLTLKDRMASKSFVLPTTVPKTLFAANILHGPDDTFYGDVILSPTNINLGLVLTAKYYTLSLWNLTGYSQALTDWVINGLDGTTVTNDDGSPVQFGPLTYRKYLLTVTANGTSNLLGNVTFHFVSQPDLVCTITGTRTVVFSFNPNWRDPVIESMEWLTDVVTAYDRTEQRLALRQFPRRSLKYLFTFENQNKVSMMEAQLFGWMSKVFVLPVWTDWQRLTANVVAGAMTAPISTPLRDYTPGCMMIFWRDYKTWEVMEIESISSMAVNFTKATTLSWAIGDRVIPVRLARLTNTATINRPTSTLTEASLEFFYEVNTGSSTNRNGVSTWPQYLGADVLMQVPNVADADQEDAISFDLKTVDASKGPWWTYGNVDSGITITRPYSWLLKTRQEIANFLAFLEMRKGKSVPFWMPSWSQDMESLQVVNPNDISLLINGIGYTQMIKHHASRSDLVFRFVDGSTPVYKHITASADPSNGTETISIDSAFGKTIPMGGFASISFLNLCRLDADSIDIQWHSDSIATVSFRICEVPQ